jgi:predicted dehydrogenase/aryl-alcohol dehydrogenase-like predicted oxidoreductase
MTLRWGILATGSIARTFAAAAAASEHNQLVAVASRDPGRARAFAASFEGVEPFESYDALLASRAVDAVYVATPHSEHARWTIRALEAGKHVLAEKPLGLDHAEVMAMVDAASQADRFLMEAFMYRCHPQTARLIELVNGGAIGDLVHLRAMFGFQVDEDPASRLFAPELGGGAILDVGCYPLSAVRLLAGEPVTLTGHGSLTDGGVDRWAAAQLNFDGGVTGQIATAITARLDNRLEVFGTRGAIRVPSPWMGGHRDGSWSFEIEREGGTETVSGQAPPLYQIEIDHVAEQIAAGRSSSPLMDWEDSLNNARLLDQWRREAGVVYPQERPDGRRGPLTGNLGRPAQLARPGSIAHLDKPVSRLVMGCDNQPGMSHAAVMWDNYFSLGGNAFDTAYIYGGGSMETLLGHWHESRNVRDDIVIVGKGAHTPHDHPKHVTRELDVSLDRLRTDFVDVYFLHRDNTDVPVGEFVDAVNDEIRRGRIRAWGGSNWTLDRIRAANDYAVSRGLQTMSAVSNNFSLAHMIRPLWPGVETATGSEFRAYLAETGLALLPWSSQARGFFTPWAETVMNETGRDNPVITGVEPTMAELATTWFSEDNFERRRRAVELAAERGVEPIQIALAYVINQPFPCFPLIGPRQIAETRSSLAALTVDLSPEECRWLDLAD